MPITPCDYELIPPGRCSDDPNAETELVHADVAITARAMTLARSRWSRRFVFFEVIDDDTAAHGCIVFPVYYGFHNVTDGSAVILHSGQPRGWYRSLTSAWRHLKRRHAMYLAWLEPDPNLPREDVSTAENETLHNPASTWYLTIPFLAHGPMDAGIRAVDATRELRSCLPGLDQLDVTIHHARNHSVHDTEAPRHNHE